MIITYGSKNNLPFDLSIDDISNIDSRERILKIYPLEKFVLDTKKNIKVTQTGKESEQLTLTYNHTNSKIAREYLDKLISLFDFDGVIDRQLEHKRTMEFAESRSQFLMVELNQVEETLQNFKEKNDLTSIELDASNNLSQELFYNNELFNAISQKDLLNLLKNVILEDKLRLLPINIGLENSEINSLILIYNNLINERNKLVSGGAGVNNNFVKNIDNQLDNYYNNLISSIDNYNQNLDLSITNLRSKENELSGFSKGIPKNQKVLRSIQRELEVKESLFLLLLQKREEAAINYAVVKPSIKVVDYSLSEAYPNKPSVKGVIFFSSLISIFLPLAFLYFWFLFDDKIHTKDQLLSEIGNDIPIIGEIPYIKSEIDQKVIVNSATRTPLAESLRMIIANLRFVLLNDNENNKKNIILVTSSVKGEGKTLISVNTAATLSNNSNKVLLIGADLRNPQIHKFLSVDKSHKGLSDYIYKNEYNWEDFIVSYEDFDILLSGTIPPNPTDLLLSKKFSDLLKVLKQKYDYVIIDSAPTLVVSDTFTISKYIDYTIYVVRASHTRKSAVNFINDIKNRDKLPGLNLVLNSVGNSRAYGYNYNYEYGYNYNYGYGYGYSYDKDDE